MGGWLASYHMTPFSVSPPHVKSDRNRGEVGGARGIGLRGNEKERRAIYFNPTVSPVLISFVASRTLAGVSRFSRPSCTQSANILHVPKTSQDM
jgi:hypothetical protein